MAKFEYKRVGRFLLVGASNAVLHFSILNIAFFYLHQSKVASSIIATVFAMVYSFILNRNFVFKSKNGHLTSQALSFILVTVFGMLLVHNAVYIGVLWALEHDTVGVTLAIERMTGGLLSADFIDINLSTVIGAAFAMVWNYNGYRIFVFKKRSKDSDEKADKSD